jgi:hypothetical protein
MLRRAALVLVLALSACSSPRYEYRYVPGRTAVLRDGQALAPPAAPVQVQMAIAAANRIAGAPYARGGGHGSGESRAFDCSGATSYVLREAGLLGGSMPSAGFRRYGEAGPGEWISVWARKGHVFLVLAGLRFDTGWTGAPEGIRWTTRSRPAQGHVVRHPRGL